MSDPEIAAMATLASALDPLPENVRARVLTWARSRYGAAPVSAAPPSPRGEPNAETLHALEDFATLGELMAACSADGDDRRVLVASAFVSQRSENGAFNAAEVNAELKHLGHSVPNITRTLDVLIAQRPALVVQLRKSGKTRQARKLYKVTEAGVREVSQMLAGGT